MRPAPEQEGMKVTRRAARLDAPELGQLSPGVLTSCIAGRPAAAAP